MRQEIVFIRGQRGREAQYLEHRLEAVCGKPTRPPCAPALIQGGQVAPGCSYTRCSPPQQVCQCGHRLRARDM